MNLLNRCIYRRIANSILDAIILIMFVSLCACSHKQSFGDVISEGFDLVEDGKYAEAQLKALAAEDMLTDETPLEQRESLARLFGFIYYNQNLRDKAGECNQQALEYALEMNDTALITIDYFNLGLSMSTLEDIIFNLELAGAYAQKAGNKLLQSSALEKLAQVYIASGKYPEAQQALDMATVLCENNYLQKGEIDVTQCRLWLAEGKYETALRGYRAISKDSLNIYGQLLRTNAIYDILVQQGDYKNALVYKDSIHVYTDSILRLDGSKKVAEIEKSYRADIARKNHRFQTIMWTSVLTVTVILIILFFVLKTLRLKKHMIELTDKIYALNARIVELMPKLDENEGQRDLNANDIVSVARLIEHKYELLLEVFRSQPQYELMRKLNLIRDLSPVNKVELSSVYDIIVGRFSGCCSDMKEAFPGLTNDDCVFFTLSFAGCSKEVISAAMGSSDEALRRRKSRIKQKLPEEVFNFFFTK